MTILIVIVLGLTAGSFLNAVIHRLHSGQSIFEKHSRCPHCGHELAAMDLVPLLSFFFLRGKCRYCSAAISWQYPLVELATVIAFLVSYINFSLTISPSEVLLWPLGNWITLFSQWVFICFLIVIFVYDFKHYLILDKVVLPGAILAIVYQIYQGEFLNALLGAFLLGGFFALLYFFSHGRWIGAGDIKFGLLLGLIVPFPATIAVFFLSYLIGGVFSSVLLIARTRRMSDRLPFGTFLSLGGFLSLLWGPALVDWYLRLIGF